MLTSTHGTVVFGGPAESDVDDKYIAPTLVKDVKGDDVLMQEELFGPILPIVAVKDLDEAIEFVRGRCDVFNSSLDGKGRITNVLFS